MTNTEAIIRTILGPIRRDTRPLACSVDCLSELLFVQKIPMDEIHGDQGHLPGGRQTAQQKSAHHFPLCGASGPMLLGGGQPRIPCQNHWPKPDHAPGAQGNAVLSLRLFSLECPVFHRCPGAALPVVLRYNPFYCNGSLIKMAIHFLHFHQVSGRFQVIFPASHRSSP